MICKCGSNIPEVRVKLGYKTCVDCSDESKWSASPITVHKTGNTIEVIKDPDLAFTINAMAERRNYGVMKGVTGSYKRKNVKKERVKKRKQEKETEFTKEIKRKKVDPSLYQFKTVLYETTKLTDSGVSKEDIDKFLSEQIQKFRISPDHKKQIIQIIEYLKV